VGYTNAGKSTLLNALTGSQVTVHDGLFTTLDPTARRLSLPSGRSAILSDTVGFIQKLPHGLVKAFRATLEDVLNSQVVVHVTDLSHPDALERIGAVNEVLREIGVLERETIMVFNKTDREAAIAREGLTHDFPGCCFISAKSGDGLDTLLRRLDEIMAREVKTVELIIPAEQPMLREVRQWSRIITEEWLPEGVRLQAEVPTKLVVRLKPWLVTDE
ncbi:MAG TPA: 50S ribosome-binding GTPase, partial [Candidatus Ozemobacteraceae bacterium]|nr:50S ribosome-binding GTPase [Candidatus Ozemobacteraceae bacterium]